MNDGEDIDEFEEDDDDSDVDENSPWPSPPPPSFGDPDNLGYELDDFLVLGQVQANLMRMTVGARFRRCFHIDCHRTIDRSKGFYEMSKNLLVLLARIAWRKPLNDR
jgi:hypothetical protein